MPEQSVPIDDFLRDGNLGTPECVCVCVCVRWFGWDGEQRLENKRV